MKKIHLIIIIIIASLFSRYEKAHALPDTLSVTSIIDDSIKLVPPYKYYSHFNWAISPGDTLHSPTINVYYTTPGNYFVTCVQRDTCISDTTVFNITALPISKGVIALTETSTGPTGQICNYVEMIVANCGLDSSNFVDIRGWIIDNNSGNFNTGGCAEDVGITPGHYRLTYENTWQKTPVGSVLVMYNHDSNIYNMPPSFTIDTTVNGLVYWIPIGGTLSTPYGKPHVEMFTANPSTSDCDYCADSGALSYVTASEWNSILSSKDGVGAIQVRCPGCTTDNSAEPAFYHGIGYGPSTGDDPFAPIAAGDNDLGGAVINDVSAFGADFVFLGSTGADFGDSSAWSRVSAGVKDSTPSTVGNVNAKLMSAIITHTLNLPCCGGGDGMRMAQHGNDTTTGIASVAQDIKVYPNPANKIVYFEFPAAANVTINISDIDGRLLNKQVISNNATSTSFNVSNYTPGVYLYQVITDHEVHSGKIIIAK